MAFLGIKIPHSISKLLSNIDAPGVKEDSSHMHITILYFGDNLKTKDISKMLDATYKITKDLTPFSIKLNCYENFPKGDDGYPIICTIKSDKLQEINKDLKKSFDNEKVEYSKKWKEYRPHITLSYHKEDIEKTNFDLIEIPITELTLWGGDNYDDKFNITFPFEIKSKADHLSSLCKQFLKMARG